MGAEKLFMGVLLLLAFIYCVYKYVNAGRESRRKEVKQKYFFFTQKSFDVLLLDVWKSLKYEKPKYDRFMENDEGERVHRLSNNDGEYFFSQSQQESTGYEVEIVYSDIVIKMYVKEGRLFQCFVLRSNYLFNLYPAAESSRLCLEVCDLIKQCVFSEA